MKHKMFPETQQERNIMNQLWRDGVAYTKDTNLTKAFGTRRDVRVLIEKDILEIARIRKKQKSVIVKHPQVCITPVVTDNDNVYYELEFIRNTV